MDVGKSIEIITKNVQNKKNRTERRYAGARWCSSVVYKFSCAGCNSVYVGETCRHISTRIREHLATDKNSHTFKHLQSSKPCKDACNDSYYEIIDSAKSYQQLKIREAFHILWDAPDLSKQVQHYNFSLAF